MRKPKHGVIDTPFLNEAGEGILRDFKDDGYHVRTMECQAWPKHVSLTKANMDGTLELFYGPAWKNDEGYRIDYLLVREETRRGQITLPVGSPAADLARRLWSRVTEHTVGLLQTPNPRDTLVGVGLVDVKAQKTDLSTQKNDEAALADSSR